ncbi:outer membrane protein assembly factor BamC [Glaciecola siphonariae]|uniref:Outer membrane protein assembly factor BamC n=1 Tax=Glaciecola siphonariae TaxID=521012 RepID=A0ABV9LSR2_9ALTE
MKKTILLSILAVAVTAGCTSSETRKRASGNFDYLEVTEAQMLKVPDDLKRPPLSNRYELPEAQSPHKILGSDVLIDSPRLVLPLVNGSHVEEGSEKATVLFDQIDDSKPLDTTIWDTVLGYLEVNNIAVESFDRENNTLVTDWVISRKNIDSSWYEFNEEVTEQARKFKLTVDVAPHGRTAKLNVENVAFVDENGDSQLANISPFELRENEVNFLNYIIQEYDFGIRLAQNERIALIRDGFQSELGFNPDGDAAFVVDAAYENAWPRLLLVLRKMGFDVIDLDQSSGLMFLKYNGEDRPWYSGIFSDEKLDLDKVNYRLLVQAVGDKTAVTFKDSDNKAFEVKQATNLFTVFSEYMAEENLDI